MKRIACCILPLLILLLLVGCVETKQEASTDAVVISRVTPTPEMTAAPTPRDNDAESVTPTLTPSVFDVDDVTMQSTPDSSCFSEIGYDSDWEVLVVRFKDSGAVYMYSNFPESEWIRFIAADSLGRWYNANIKDQYEYEKIDG